VIERLGVVVSASDPVATIRLRMKEKKPNKYGSLLAGPQLDGRVGRLGDGLYLSGIDYALCVGGGAGIGFQRHGTAYGVVQDLDGYLLDKSWKGGADWRRRNNRDKNTKTQNIPSSYFTRAPDEPRLVIGAALFVHRKYVSEPGDPVVHTEGYLTVDVERKKREALLQRMTAEHFGHDHTRLCIRLPELEYLELDMYVPQRNLAIEHQGQQHYFPVEAWGGAAALAGVQKRDVRKRELCKRLGITLIEWRYDEVINAAEYQRRVIDILG